MFPCMLFRVGWKCWWGSTQITRFPCQDPNFCLLCLSLQGHAMRCFKKLRIRKIEHSFTFSPKIPVCHFNPLQIRVTYLCALAFGFMQATYKHKCLWRKGTFILNKIFTEQRDTTWYTFLWESLLVLGILLITFLEVGEAVLVRLYFYTQVFVSKPTFHFLQVQPIAFRGQSLNVHASMQGNICTSIWAVHAPRRKQYELKIYLSFSNMSVTIEPPGLLLFTYMRGMVYFS